MPLLYGKVPHRSGKVVLHHQLLLDGWEKVLLEDVLVPIWDHYFRQDS